MWTKKSSSSSQQSVAKTRPYILLCSISYPNLTLVPSSCHCMKSKKKKRKDNRMHVLVSTVCCKCMCVCDLQSILYFLKFLHICCCRLSKKKKKQKEQMNKRESEKTREKSENFKSFSKPKIQLSRFIVISVCALVSITMFGHFHLSLSLTCFISCCCCSFHLI